MERAERVTVGVLLTAAEVAESEDGSGIVVKEDLEGSCVVAVIELVVCAQSGEQSGGRRWLRVLGAIQWHRAPVQREVT